MDVVADGLDLGFERGVFGGGGFDQLLLFLLERNLLLELLVGVFLGLGKVRRNPW